MVNGIIKGRKLEQSLASLGTIHVGQVMDIASKMTIVFAQVSMC